LIVIRMGGRGGSLRMPGMTGLGAGAGVADDFVSAAGAEGTTTGVSSGLIVAGAASSELWTISLRMVD